VYLMERGEAATGVPCRALPVPYDGWRATRAEIRLREGDIVACHALLRSAATPDEGLTAEVIDLGRGTPEEFEAHRGDIAGRMVLVRHELMFAAGTIHRRRKIEMARDAGASAFLIAGPEPGSLVAGSAGEAGLPAAGLTPEVAARLRRTARGWANATLRIGTVDEPATSRTLLFDCPGRTRRWIVLSAHLDGHDLAESAIDNASGVAAALAVARALRPYVRDLACGLRLVFFSVEEWALTGSALYVQGLSPEERSAIALNINLDSVAGGTTLSALTSGFASIEPFLLSVAEANGIPLRCVRPLARNSDHANFAEAGIPAFRLVAGFDEPNANTRLVLTERDTRALVDRKQLVEAARLGTALWHAAASRAGADTHKA
jgi:aminopeptidase YwaD